MITIEELNTELSKFQTGYNAHTDKGSLLVIQAFNDVITDTVLQWIKRELKVSLLNIKINDKKILEANFRISEESRIEH